MVNGRRRGRLGMLAVGFGIGAAVASAPGIAGADSPSADLINSLSALDPFAAAVASPTDIDISFDGFTIFDGGGTAVATTTPGDFDFAIAVGAGANATATGGFFDYANAEGTNANAAAGGTAGSNFDSATDIGNNPNLGGSDAGTDGAFAVGTGAGTSSGNTAIEIGNNEDPLGHEGAFAGGQGVGNGNGDEALSFGNLGGYGSGSYAVDGNNDTASVFSTSTTDFEGFASASDGNHNFATAIGGLSGHGISAYAANGNNDIAFALDPNSASGSSADAGYDAIPPGTGNFDLAAVFGDGLHASAVGVNDTYDILPALFGDGTGTFAATAAAELSGLVGGFSSLLSDIGA